MTSLSKYVQYVVLKEVEVESEVAVHPGHQTRGHGPVVVVSADGTGVDGAGRRARTGMEGTAAWGLKAGMMMDWSGLRAGLGTGNVTGTGNNRTGQDRLEVGTRTTEVTEVRIDVRIRLVVTFVTTGTVRNVVTAETGVGRERRAAETRAGRRM